MRMPDMKIKPWIARQYSLTAEAMRMIPWWVSVMFVLSVIAMNLLASKCIVSRPYLALDAGILVSWISFLSMDLVVKIYGKQAANRLVLVAIAGNFFTALVFYLGASVPGTWSEATAFELQQDAVNASLNATIGGSWQVLFGSMIAFLSSSLLNNFLNSKIGKLFSRDTFATFACRSYISTIAAQVFDNLVFAFLISKFFFNWSVMQCLMCSVAGAVFETFGEVVASPLGYYFYVTIQKRKAPKCVTEGNETSSP